MILSRALPPVLRSGFPRAGSPSGAQKKYEFIAALNAIMGDVRFLWMPDQSETTTSTDLSRHGATITYDATFAGKYSTLGSGLYATFDGTADEADCPDNDRYSFGDGAVDEPFSIVALINPSGGAAAQTILAKFNATSHQEWKLWLNASEQVLWEVHDESASASLSRYDNTALTLSTWVLVIGTYDGSAAESGLNIYKNGVLRTPTSNSSGTYIAMENLAAVLTLGHEINSTTARYFFPGGMALIGLCAKQLLVHDAEALTQLCNGYCDLSL